MPRPRKYSKKTKKAYKSKDKRHGKITAPIVKKIVKSVLEKRMETKQILAGFSRSPLYHNGGASGITGAQFNLTNGPFLPLQGTSESQRVGNEIYVKGWRMTFMITLPYDRLNTSLRILVLSVPKGYNPLGTYDQLFDSVSNNVMTDPVETDRVQVIQQYFINATKYVSFNPNVPTGTNRELTIFRKIWIPFNKKLKFNEDNSQATSYGRDIIIVAHAFDAWGSLSSDIVSYIKCDAKLYFKDI